MVAYYTNFDFEKELYFPSKNYNFKNKINAEFEYFYFLFKEKNALANIVDYSKEYKDKIFNLVDFETKLTSDFKTKCEFLPWWGNNLSNIELKQKINSKKTSWEIAKKNNWGIEESFLYEAGVDSSNIMKLINCPFIEKSFFNMSGMGNTVYQSKPLKLKGNSIVEPYLNVLKNIGTTICLKKNEVLFQVENFNDKNGQFKGGKLLEDTFEKNIFLDIAKVYSTMGAYGNIQIDSLIYEKDGGGVPYFLVEVNWRKTMGLVIKKVSDLFGEGALFFVPQKKMKTTNVIKIEEKLASWEDEKVFLFSPEGHIFHAFFVPESICHKYSDIYTHLLGM